jgi:antitoxin VapB
MLVGHFFVSSAVLAHGTRRPRRFDRQCLSNLEQLSRPYPERHSALFGPGQVDSPGVWHMLRHMSAERHVKLFRNGRNQAVRIPREFELPGEDAIIRQEGDRLVIEPVPPRSLLALLATLEPIDEDFPPIDELPHDPVEL